MKLNIKDFREACKTISTAVDNNAANLELKVKNNRLYLSVTNKEYFTSIMYDLENSEDFEAVIDANLFLNLISGITSDEVEIVVEDNHIKIKAGKSSYKLPMIYENDHLMELPAITIQNKTVEMPISNEILQSILTVNGKELLKLKALDSVTALQKCYYITNEGAFNCTNGATLNAFNLEKPIQMLLNDRIVKLFKLFKEDVSFSFGHDALPSGQVQTKVCFETGNIYLAAIIANDDILLSQMKGYYTATKNYISEAYTVKTVLSANQLSGAIGRLLLFTKNSVKDCNKAFIPATIKISGDEFNISDSQGNIESVTVENGSYVGEDYELKMNIADLKLVLDTCKDEHVTFNCGNHKSIIINRKNISHLIPEIKN